MEVVLSSCAICSKDTTSAGVTHIIYSAIEQRSEIKTGFKSYETRMRTVEPQQHNLIICQSCQRKYSILIPAFSLIGAVVLAIWLTTWPFFFNQGIFVTVLCLWLPIVGGALYLVLEFFGLSARLKSAAVKEREKTHWQHALGLKYETDPNYLRARNTLSVIGLTEDEYRDVLKKQSSS